MDPIFWHYFAVFPNYISKIAQDMIRALLKAAQHELWETLWGSPPLSLQLESLGPGSAPTRSQVLLFCCEEKGRSSRPLSGPTVFP